MRFCRSGFCAYLFLYFSRKTTCEIETLQLNSCLTHVRRFELNACPDAVARRVLGPNLLRIPRRSLDSAFVSPIADPGNPGGTVFTRIRNTLSDEVKRILVHVVTFSFFFFLTNIYGRSLRCRSLLNSRRVEVFTTRRGVSCRSFTNKTSPFFSCGMRNLLTRRKEMTSSTGSSTETWATPQTASVRSHGWCIAQYSSV